MELDDLKQVLTTLDDRLEKQAVLRTQEIVYCDRARARSFLWPLSAGQIIQAAFGFLTTLFAIAAWRGNIAHPGVFVSGIVLHIYGVAMIALAVKTLVMIVRVDPAEPVLAMQRQLAKVHYVNVISGYALGMSWWLLWVPFLIVVANWMTGVDLYAESPSFWLMSIAVGIAGFVGVALLNRWALRRADHRLARIFDAIFTGASLRKAQTHLAELSRFEPN